MSKKTRDRRRYDEALKREAVQMLLDGYAASSIAENLGIRSVNSIYAWRDAMVSESPLAESLEEQVRQLREQLARTERERDILKKALSIFSQRM